ncbi:MAG: BspA family leucine-rich repeat surface protein [Lachnospiraceae bacterium]|uniref:BspA family leucine-rich repeat surface protein n=1 Tax=Galactobacillus timonensis TaxID=2041840 RepID=UPI0023F1D22C|nr:BspA family leucine-rich repeat surface protein [Galactobacillus timonensis]MDD7087603.1 BspA family leucine-rich repeat surface protein [Galactobacillus timonensis]MDY5222312.1 BspA family leucine-rich repeat surface protein [Lachnospiraceae bacterium]
MKKLICSIFSIAMILTLNTSPIHAEDTGESSGGGGTVILPTEEPTVQQSNQSTAAPEGTGEDAPASPSATAEASADPTAAPAETAAAATTSPSTDAEETTAPEATVTPEASADPTAEPTADPSASPSSAPVFKAPMMAPAPAATTTASLEKGQTFNVAIKKLAGNSNATIYNTDATVKAFKRSSKAPAGVTTADISASQDGSIVAWFDSLTGTVYWYSAADKILLNADSSFLFMHMNTINSIDAEYFDTSNVTNMSDMFADCNSLTSLDVSKWDVSKVTDMSSMFWLCNNLTSLDVSDWDTSSVTDISFMFYDCGKLATLSVSKWDVSEVTNMECVFDLCQSLTSLDVTNWNTHNVTELGNMFEGCKNLASLDVTNWDTSNVTSTAVMFNGCKKLTSLDVSKWDVSKVKAMWYMFEGCESLTTIDLSSWDTGSVVNMDELFKDCSGLQSMVFGSKFFVRSADNTTVFPTPSTTVSGVKSNGKWGFESEMAPSSYTAAELGNLGATVGALTGTWYAQRDDNVATITFDTNGGDSLPVPSKFVMLGDEYGDLPTPTRAGYTFSGWYTAASGGIQVTSATVCTGSTTIYARWVWDSSTYTIKFDINYRDAVGAPENMLVKLGSSIPQPDISKMENFDGLRLDGWYLEPECRREFTSFGDQLDKEIVDKYFGTGTTLTLYAGWWTKYKLTFNPDGGTWLDDSSTADKDITSENNVPYSIPFNVKKFGYTLDHWKDSFQKTYRKGDLYTGIEGGGYLDDEMTAVWKPNVYSVNFNANGGINAPADQNLVFENDAIFSPDVKAMTRQGYTFNGWYLDSACKVPFDYFNKKMDENTLSSLTEAGAIDSNDTITLYAGWKAAAAPSATPSATASTPANNNRGSAASTSNGSIFFPITSAQKFIPATGAGGENNN